MKKRLMLIALILGAGLLPPNAMADSYSDYGMILFKQRNFKSAGLYFAQSLRANPNNPTALYYSSLCCQMLGNAEAARNGFYTVLQVFPKSPEAALARQALAGSVQPAPKTASQQPPAARPGKDQVAAPATEASSVLSPEEAAHVTVFRKDINTANTENGVKVSLTRIPQPVKDAVFGEGCKIVITPTILDYRPELKNEKPRGYTHGGGYDNCPAMFQPGPNEILVAETWSWQNGPSRPGRAAFYQEALGHEFGHAFDSFMGKVAQGGRRSGYWYITDTAWYYETYRKEAQKLSNDQRRNAAYYTQPGTGGGSELFAELFASLYSAAPSAEQQMLAGYFPETRRKIAALASLKTFSQESLQAAMPDLSEKAVAAASN